MVCAKAKLSRRSWKEFPGSGPSVKAEMFSTAALRHEPMKGWRAKAGNSEAQKKCLQTQRGLFPAPPSCLWGSRELTFMNSMLWILLKTGLKCHPNPLNKCLFFGMWQIVQKYLNTEQDTFSEKISLLERRNLVQKSIFSLIICINRNADTSNDSLGFLYITLRWQPFAQCPEKYFKDFKAASFGDLSPRLQRWSSSRHLAFNHWASLAAFTSFSFNHTL